MGLDVIRLLMHHAFSVAVRVSVLMVDRVLVQPLFEGEVLLLRAPHLEPLLRRVVDDQKEQRREQDGLEP